ncbi:MAG TPA: adenylate/guanylate cyclase domain-containing protein [Stenomitos sp.]
MSDSLKSSIASRGIFPSGLRFNNWSIQSKLQALLLLVSLSSVLMVGWISWYQGRMTLRTRAAEQLTGIRAARATQFEQFFESLDNQVRILASDSDTIEAMVAFNKGFGQLERSVVAADWDEWDRSLQTYYTEKFFPRLSKNISKEDLQYDSYRPQGQAARYLQYHYIAQNPNPVGEKEKLFDPGDGSEYTQSHAQYQPLFKQIIKDYGYYDLLLINPKTLDIVYSVFKETDFATTLKQGPYSQSGLSDAVQAVLANPARGSIQVADFKPYRPSYEAPALFLATPIYSGSNLIGILAVQIPAGRINQIMSNANNWKSSGLGKTGDAYLVGPDRFMRSVSRFWTETPNDYKSEVRRLGTSEQMLGLMESLNTTIGLQRVESPITQAAIGGQEGIGVVRNYRGKQVLSSYAPLKMRGVNWAILAEIETGEVYQPVYILQLTLLIAAVIFLLLSAFLAGLSSRLFTLPLRRLTQSAKKIEAGELDEQMATTSNDEFGQLFEAFNGIANRLQQTRKQLEAQQQENDALLRNFVPGAVAARLKKGETIIANQLNKITLLYAHIAGIAELSKRMPSTEVTQLLTQLFDEFDVLAERYGMERQQTISSDYMAVCGLTQTHFDHTKRTVDFALAMLNSLQNIARGQPSELGLQIAIHTGSVNAGVVGTQIFGYKLWGEDVDLTTRLYPQANANAMIVTRPVYEQLADTYTFSLRAPVTIENVGKVEIWTLGGNNTVLSSTLTDLRSGSDRT